MKESPKLLGLDGYANQITHHQGIEGVKWEYPLSTEKKRRGAASPAKKDLSGVDTEKQNVLTARRAYPEPPICVKTL